MKKLANWINSKTLKPTPFIFVSLVLCMVYNLVSKRVAGVLLHWYEFDGILKLPFGLLDYASFFFLVLSIALWYLKASGKPRK